MSHRYLPRFLKEKLIKLFANFSIVAVTGARQVGKSTLLENAFPDLSRIVFDPIVDIEGAKADPDLFLKNRGNKIILDEIQYVPELVPALKRFLEKDRTSGQYLVTGSQQWSVMKSLAESLAGRAVFLDLDSFCLLEIAEYDSGQSWLKNWVENPNSNFGKNINKAKLPFTTYEQIWRGFMPEAQFLSSDLIGNYYSSYQRTYIERDVRLMADISDLHLFNRFLRLCSALTSQEINHSQLGRELGLTPQTVGRWLDILEGTFQWHEIQPYSGNSIKRISGKPKGYISDTGFACFSQAVSAPELLGGYPMWGSLFETAVINDIRKQCYLFSTPPNFYHWRTVSGAEVDLLLEWNGKFYPIEVKGKTNLSKRDASGIRAFRETYPKLSINPGLIVAPVDTFYQIAEDAFAMPWDGCFVEKI